MFQNPFSIRDFIRELRASIRMNTRHPAFFCSACCILAVGIGATSSVFAITRAVLLAPLPFPDPDRLFVIQSVLEDSGKTRNFVSPGAFLDVLYRNRSFERVGACTDAYYTASGQGQATERIYALMASPSLLRTLGTQPAEGRFFTDFEWRQGPDPATVVILSSGMWAKRFPGKSFSPQTLLLGDQRYDVIGVLPKNFFFFGRKVDAIVPLRLPKDDNGEPSRSFRYLTVIGRRSAHVSPKIMQADVSRISRELAMQYPLTDGNRRFYAKRLDSVVFGNVAGALLALLIAVGSLLLIACMNVSSLLLARSVSTRKDVAVRLALGARRADLFRHLFVEASLIAITGSIIGLVLSRVSLGAVLSIAPAGIPRIRDTSIDIYVLAFSLMLGFLSSIFLALIPFCEVARRDISTSLRDSMAGCRSRTSGIAQQSWMMTGEIALAALLSIITGLCIKTVLNLQRIDPGFKTAGAFAFEISLPERYAADTQKLTFFRDLVSRISELPGVNAVGITNRLPLSGENSTRSFSIGAVLDPKHEHEVQLRRVSPGFRRALGMQLIRGRAIHYGDTGETPAVAVVNRAFAKQFFKRRDVLGQTILLQDGDNSRPRRIVGIFNDVKHFSLTSEPEAEVYLPFAERPYANMSVVVRTTSDSSSLIAALRHVCAVLDPEVPITNFAPLGDFVLEAQASQRFRTSLIASFSFLALLLASIGIYGITSYVVVQRRSEFGIRMALGAQPVDIARFVLAWATRTATTGIIVGAVLAACAAYVGRHLLFGVEPMDVSVFLPSVSALFLVTLVAAFGPSIRAARLDPTIAMRE
jgi:putative ABC transport system permease protein